MPSFKLKSSWVTILQGVEFSIFPLILAWALQQCSATALPVIMLVLGYGRDEMLAVFLAKTYCLPILLYGCETWHMSSDKHKLDVAWNNCFRKKFNACWRESAKPLLFYCGTMPVSLLVDQRKRFFYNKTLRSTNIVLRVVCRLQLYEA